MAPPPPPRQVPGQHLGPRPAAKLSPQTKRRRPRKKCAVARPPSAPPGPASGSAFPLLPRHLSRGGGEAAGRGSAQPRPCPWGGGEGSRAEPPPPPRLLPGEVAARGKSATGPGCSSHSGCRFCPSIRESGGKGAEERFTAPGVGGFIPVTNGWVGIRALGGL